MLRGALIALVSLPAVAHAGPKEIVEMGKELYLEGRYQEALTVLDEAKGDPELTEEQRIDLLETQAFSLYLMSLFEEAKATWLRLLAIDPWHQLDPVDVSPVLISFFSRIEPPPGEAPAATVEPSVDTTPRGAIEAGAERGCGIVLCLIPLGVGQFANDQIFMGFLFATLELGFLAANIGINFSRQATFDRDPVNFDEEADQTNATVQNVMLGLFGATVVIGVLDAFLWY